MCSLGSREARDPPSGPQIWPHPLRRIYSLIMEDMQRAMDPPVQKLLKKSKYYLLCTITSLFLLTFILAFLSYTFLLLRRQKPKSMLAEERIAVREPDHVKIVNVSRMVCHQPYLLMPCKEDALAETPWLAPIVWEAAFNIHILNEQFWIQNDTIGLVVFAIGEHIVFLKLFLETAEKYFMVGHRMKYYIFTDQPDHIPFIQLQKRRQMVILEVLNHTHDQDMSMYRMELISKLSQQRFVKEVDYMVCTQVDMKFCNSVSVEILSSLFGTLHPLFYERKRHSFPYERRPQSQAYIPKDEGDFYYTGALFGGKVLEVYKLAKSCHQAMMMDQADHIKAVWDDESYLNKYLLYHKPTKVLSPEYMWDKKLLKHVTFKRMVDKNDVLPKITKQSSTEGEDFQEEVGKGQWPRHHNPQSEKPSLINQDDELVC